jgi:hypothetical protein
MTERRERESEESKALERLKNPGGTRGGFGEFILGLALLVGGGWLFMNNVIVTTEGGYALGWFGSRQSFGILLIPLFLGIVLLFFNGRSPFGWILTLGSAVAMFVSIVANLGVHWMPSSLGFTLIVVGMIAAGLGLIARAVRAH